MPRPEKVQAVEEIKERLEGSEAVFITEYRGLSVSSMQTLRRSLRDASAEYKIYKMSLARLAATEAGLDELMDLLQGPTGVAFTQADPVPAAKALKTFADDNSLLVLKGGLLAGEALTAEKVRELAELDSREMLLAKLAGAFQAPMVNLAGIMASLLRGTANLVSQLIDKREAAGEAPAEADEPEAADDGRAATDDAAGEVAEAEAEEAEAAEQPAAAAEPENADDGPAATDDAAGEVAEAEAEEAEAAGEGAEAAEQEAEAAEADAPPEDAAAEEESS